MIKETIKAKVKIREINDQHYSIHSFHSNSFNLCQQLYKIEKMFIKIWFIKKILGYHYSVEIEYWFGIGDR